MKDASIAVTVIVPMRDEEQRIGPCLDSILANEFPREQLEVLVVDGLSTDRSASIAMAYAARFEVVRVLANPAKVVPAALNIGIREARGRVIIIMGAHSEYPPHYIGMCLRVLETTHAEVVGSVLKTLPGGNTLTARAVALVTQHPFGVGGSAFRTGRAGRYVDTVPYGAYRRDVFERVGLFNQNLTRNQDFEFNARIRAAGGKLFLSSDGEIAYYNVPDVRGLARQAFDNGRWLPEMWVASRVSLRLRHMVPLVFVLVLLGCVLLAPLRGEAVILGVSTLTAYGLAAMAVATQISYRKGARFFFPLLGLFFTQHVMYGIGTLAGLLRVAGAHTIPATST